jgi:hypothetical protein
MEALFSSLIKLDVPNTHCVDVSGRLTRLAFTNFTKAVQLTRRFGMVLTMDCTYKTNRFKMPLLHIVSFACTGRPSHRPLRFSVQRRLRTMSGH